MEALIYALNRLALLVALPLAALIVSNEPEEVAASSPSQNWYSYHMDTTAAAVLNSTGESIFGPLLAWNTGSILSPFEVSFGADVYIDPTSDSMIGYDGWLEHARHGFTICGGLPYGDTFNCNHSSVLADWGLIYINYYDPPSALVRSWIFTHELGHMFGLAHHASDNLMFGDYSSSSDWDWTHVNSHIDYWY